MKALVIDDSGAIRKLIGRILKEVGFDQISEAVDGQDALDRLSQIERPELVCVDWNMPNMNGYEFIQKVRSDVRYNNLTLMMVTTETEMTQVEKALAAGANEFVMKPFNKDILLEKLRILGLAPLEQTEGQP